MARGKSLPGRRGRASRRHAVAGRGILDALSRCCAGHKITVSLRISGRGLQPTDKGTPAVWLQFTDETNQHRRRSFLVGKDDSGTMHQPKCTTGDFEWTDVKETITAPEGAVRMALFLGLLPCKGKIEFDDIDIQTAGEAASVAAEILPPNLPPQVIKEMHYVDLSKVANRALMKDFTTGERRFGGLPFKIPDGQKSVVVLKSSARANGDLPEKVAIPVGRKFDTLFFLHSGAGARPTTRSSSATFSTMPTERT